MSGESSSPAFNPALRGTAESRWEGALAAAPTLPMPQAAILVVSPHPDDETLGAGGLIRSATNAGQKVSVISVTDGESAYPDWTDLNQVRCNELSHALAVLSPRSITTKRLAIPDGRVAQHRQSLFDAIDRLVSGTTTLVAPYELDGHPDHDATGEICCEVARLRGLTLWRYPVWMWHHGTPERFANHAWGRIWLDSDTQRAKALAIECFISQIRPPARAPIVPAHVLAYFSRPYEAFLV